MIENGALLFPYITVKATFPFLSMVRFDPKAEKFQSWLIPSGGGVVRNMMPAKDGNIWLACSGVTTIAMVEVKKSNSN